jgi:hypothetical protein
MAFVALDKWSNFVHSVVETVLDFSDISLELGMFDQKFSFWKVNNVNQQTSYFFCSFLAFFLSHHPLKEIILNTYHTT